MNAKDKIINEALLDYVGFLFSYTKDLEEKIEELRCQLEEQEEKNSNDEVAYNHIVNKTEVLN